MGLNQTTCTKANIEKKNGNWSDANLQNAMLVVENGSKIVFAT
jgi:hypothetical protein